jgi:anthranilate phosphoribosyltransferase
MTRAPEDYGLAICSAESLAGADAATNAARLRAALAGADSQAHRDALALGAGLALEVTGTSPDLAAGVRRAQAAIADGAARELLAKLDAFAETLR